MGLWAFSREPQYHPLSKEAQDESDQPGPKATSSSWKGVAFGTVIGALAVLLLLSLTKFNLPQCPTIRGKQWTNSSCGHTPDSAATAGCIFDPMMNAWLHPECYDEELSMEFRGLRDWKFYKDHNATILLTDEEFSRAGDAWGSWEYHIAHCIFSFRKLHKALRRGGNIEREIAMEPHTEHCVTVMNYTFNLMQKAEDNGEHFSMRDMGTVLHTGFPSCRDAINFLPYEGVVIS